MAGCEVAAPLVAALRAAASDAGLPIGEAWNLLDRAADRIEQLEIERGVLLAQLDWQMANAP